MLCEMRGFDGSMSGWNGSHGSVDSSRGLCVFRKMEIGAYVVNSNRASGHNSYYQGENDSDVVFAHHESRHQGYPDSWRHELRASKMYGSQHLDKEHQKRRVERSVLRERHQPDYGSTSNHQSTTAEKHSGSHPNTSENYLISTQEMETTNQSTDGSLAGNIYQGPIVRVQVPEVYYEGGSTRGTGTAVTYRHSMSYNVEHEQKGQDLKHAREMDEIYGSPVSETYRRINEWLKNCQQHSSASFKSRTENKLKQNTTSGNFSKADYRTHSQTGNSSNLKLKPTEPQFIAALEPKATKAGNVMLQPNNQQRHRNTDWTEKREVPFRQENQSLAPRNNDVTSAFSSNYNHVVNATKPFYESGRSKTSSEWSSETLSIVGSDKSSYCTDFTPFELGSADSYVGIHQMDSVSTSAHESPSNVGKNVLISHVTIDDRMQRKNVTRTKEFSEALHDSFGNEFGGNRRNDKSSFDSGRNNNFGQKSKQQRPQDRLTDKPPKNPTDFKASSQSSKTGRVVTVFIGDAQRTQQGNPQSDNSTKQSTGLQNNVRYKKATADPANSADVQNLKISDRRVFKGDRKSVQVPSETKPYTSDRKPMIPLRCTSLEYPLSSQFTDQPFSIPADSSGYKKSSSEEDSALPKQLESRPVPQMRSGSLSITIRPNRLTVMDYFKKIDDVWDSSGRREEPELKGTVEQSSDIESLQEIGDDTAADARALDINDGIDGLNSGSRDDVSDESEELDEFTKTVIKSDVSGKAPQSSSKTEFPSKPQYNVLKLSKNLKPDISTLLADVHSRFAGKVDQKLDDKNTDSEDEINRNLKEQAMFEGDIPLSSIPSYRGSRGQPQDCHSSTGWLPGKLANSPDRDLQMKFTQNDGLVDDSFGHNSEYMKSKYEDMLETDFRSSSQRKHSEMYLLTNESVSPGFQSFNRNRSDSHNFTSGVTITPNGSADRMAPVSGELYTDDRSHMETASPRSLPPASQVVSDAFHNHSGLDSVQCSKVKATTDKSNEEDRFLMSLLQSHTPDLPAYESFSTPHLQSQNLVRTLDFTMRSNYGYKPFRLCTDQFDEAASKSVMKSPKTFEGRHLQYEEPSSLEGGKDHSEEFCQQKSTETEYSRTLLKNSPDSLLSVLVEGAATPAAIQRCQSQKSDSMTHKDSELQDNNGCSKISEKYADASFIINNTVKNSEPMSCQEVIDFPENVVIAPPESFSDFTIML